MSTSIPKNIVLVTNPYHRMDSDNRKGIMVKGPWVKEIEAYILENNIRAVYLNSAKGWKDTDYSFLARLTTIEELHIIVSKTNNIVSIENMSNLMQLSLTCNTHDTIDFSKLKKLEKCYLYWWPGANSIVDAVTLTELYLDSAKLTDFSALCKLINLKMLTVANSNITSTNSISCLNHLTRLELLNCRKLTSFDNISQFRALNRLTIDGSKGLSNIGFVEKLNKLEYLCISNNGDIDSLLPLANLKQLKALAFSGNTKIVDGELSILTTLKSLAMLNFSPRKHYTHKLIKKWNWKNYNNPDTLLVKRT